MKRKIRFIFIFVFCMLVAVSYAKDIKDYVLLHINEPYVLTSSEPYDLEIMHKKQKYKEVKKEQWKKEETYYKLDLPFEKEGIYELAECQLIVHANQPLLQTNSPPYLDYHDKQVYLKQTEFYVLKDETNDFKMLSNEEIILPNKQMIIDSKNYDYYLLSNEGKYQAILDGKVAYDFYILKEQPQLQIVEDFKDSNFVKKEERTFIRLNKEVDPTITLTFDNQKLQHYLEMEPIIITLKEGQTNLKDYWPFPLEKSHLYIVDNTKPKLIGLVPGKDCYYVKEMPKFTIDEPYLDEKMTIIFQDGKKCKLEEIENKSSTLSFQLVDEARNRYETEFKIIVDQNQPLLEIDDTKITIVEEHLKDCDLKATLNEEPFALQFTEQTSIIPQNVEGILKIEGEITDLAGNVATINQTTDIDFKAPEISDKLVGNIYHINTSDYHFSSLKVEIIDKENHVQTSNNNQIQLKDGIYQTKIICYDKFNHYTTLENELIVDTKPPSITCNLEQEIITDPNWNFEIKVEDALLKSWSYILKRNNQIIESDLRKTNRFEKKVYDENQYIDDGKYELECVAYDLSGKKTTLKKQFKVITKKPMLTLFVDQASVKPTNIISLVQDATLTLKTNKGNLSWELYFNDQKLEIGTKDNIQLKRQEGTYVLDVYAIDEYGFKDNKRYIFHYPKKKTAAIVNKEENITLENVIPNKEQLPLPSSPVIEKKEEVIQTKEHHHILKIGGGLVAFSLFGWFLYRRKRSS